MGVSTKRTNEERTKEYVNSLPIPTAGHSGTVEQMVTDAKDDELVRMEEIDDETVTTRPVPTKNKRPTAAEQFRREHEAEYEDRDRPPGHCRRVQERNRACPQLRDELERKRSTANPIAMQAAAKVTVFDPNCRKCVKEKIARENKAKRDQEKADRRRKEQEKKLKSRVTKTKPKRKICKKQACYVRNLDCKFIPPETSKPGIHIKAAQNVATQNTRDNNNSVQNKDGQSQEKVDIVQDLRTSKDSVQNIDGTSQEKVDSVSRVFVRNRVASKSYLSSYPGSSRTSVTSYYSFGTSVNQEPMVE